MTDTELASLLQGIYNRDATREITEYAAPGRTFTSGETRKQPVENNYGKDQFIQNLGKLRDPEEIGKIWAILEHIADTEAVPICKAKVEHVGIGHSDWYEAQATAELNFQITAAEIKRALPKKLEQEQRPPVIAPAAKAATTATTATTTAAPAPAKQQAVENTLPSSPPPEKKKRFWPFGKSK